MENNCIYRPFGLLTGLLIIFFSSAHAQSVSRDNPEEWKFSCQRDALAPKYYVDNRLLFEGKPTLVLTGNGKPFANGYWYTIKNIESGKYYRFHTHFKVNRVEEINRSVLARILWFDENGRQVERAEYPALIRTGTSDGWKEIRQIYQAPEKAVVARLELIYRWDNDGMVHFGGTTMEETEKPDPRNVRLATVFHRPSGTKSASENLEQFKKLVIHGAGMKADIVCLPEAITMVGTPFDYISASEPVPGPTTLFLGELAKTYHIYIVAGIIEREKDVIYNTSVLIDRNGNLAGKYRKLSLPREEIDGGITPGNVSPVFDTDFGRIGMMICWDVFFPETARALASKGAEIIFLPIWGGNLNLARARAIENQVFLVSSTYDMKSAVFDQEGEIMKEATKDVPVVVVEIDLNKQKLWPWLGDFKNRIPSEMPPRKAVYTDFSP